MNRRLAVTLLALVVTALLSATPATAGNPLTLFTDNMDGGGGKWQAAGFWNLVTNPENIPVSSSGTLDCPPNDISPDLVTLPLNADQASGVVNSQGQAFLPRAFSGASAWWYGVPANGTFIDSVVNFAIQGCKNGGESGANNGGSLTTIAPINLTGLLSATLHFKTWFEIESLDAQLFDQMHVQVVVVGSGQTFDLGTLNPTVDVNGAPDQPFTSGGFTSGACDAVSCQPPYAPNPAVWVDRAFSLNTFLGQSVRVQFTFQTGDTHYNGFRGWLIDDVVVDGISNNPPVALNDSYTVVTGDTLNVVAPGVLANDSDSDGPNPLTAALITGPAHAAALGFALHPDGSFFYTPAVNFLGNDSFTYRAFDGVSQSNLATVTINVIPQTGALSGTVTDAFNSPIVGATVLTRPDFPGGTSTSTVTTGTSGFYTFTGLVVGSYRVSAQKDNFVTQWYNGKPSQQVGDHVAVARDTTTAGVDFKLASGAGGISGCVTDTLSNSLANVAVNIHRAAGDFVMTTTTGATGGCPNYSTGLRLAPGSYKVTASAAGSETIAYNNKSSVATGDPVSVTAGTATTGINISLPQFGAISGHVTISGGGALSGAVIDVFDFGSNSFVASAATAGDGSYTVGALQPLQAYRVRARRAGFATVFANNKSSGGTADQITVPAGGTTTVDFVLAQGGGIIGRVTDAVTGLGVNGAIIDIFNGASDNTAPSNNFSTNGFITGGFVTSGDGNFNTGRMLAPGNYKVKARQFNSGYIETFYVNGLDYTTATSVTVTAGADFTLNNLPLPKGGTITGTIRDRVSTQPIAGANVVAQRVASSNFFGAFNVTTNASGQFSITGLHEGEWLISAQATGYILGWSSGDPSKPATDFSSSTPIQITGTSAASNVDLNLQPGGGEIRGRITRSDNGQPVPPGTQVAIRGPLPRASTVSFGFPILLTDAQGNYSYSGLPPGQYVVEALRNQAADGTGTATGFFPFGAISRGTGAPVTVTDGAATTADFQVLGFPVGDAPRVIRGTLKDQSNILIPIRNAFVFAFEPTAFTLVRVVSASDDGSFVMDGLAPGRYLLTANTEKTFVTTAFEGETVLNASTLIDTTAGNVAGINIVLPNTAGTITGTITRSDTHLPLLGANISIRNFADNGPGGATSRADGTFLVRGLAPGTYKVRVSAPKFVTKFFVFDVLGGTRLFNDGSFVTATSGQNTPGIDVALDPTGGALTGTVRRQDSLEPVMATVVGIHDAATGSDVTFLPTDVNGVYKTEGLGPGDFTVRVFDVAGERDASGQVLASRYATQWFSGKSTRESSDPVTVAPVGVTGGIDFLVSPTQGSISGQAFRNNETPLGGVAISIFDQATGGFVRGAGVTDHNGHYAATGLAPGSYVARAAALGFARQFYSNAPTSATATALTIASDVPNINFFMTLSSDITGTISYGGLQTGPLRVRLFSDAGLTHQVYETVIPSPSFTGSGQGYSFKLPPPDTRGILPGTYYVSAFIDSNGNGFRDSTEAFGQLGAPTPTALTVVAENTTLPGQDFAISDPAANNNTAPVAQSQQIIVVQGSSSNSIILTGLDAETATANLTYTVTGGPSHGTLTITEANPQQRFYTPASGFTGTDTFTFQVTDNCFGVATPCSPLTSAPATVTIQVTSNTGVTIRPLSVPTIVSPSASAQLIGEIAIIENTTGALAANSKITLTLPTGLTFDSTLKSCPTGLAAVCVSFDAAYDAVLASPFLEPESGGQAVSFTLTKASTQGPLSIRVSSMKVVVAQGFLGPDVNSADVLTTLSGPNPGLLGQAVAVKNATAVAQSSIPTLTDVTPATAGRGAVGRVVVLTGANFASDASVSFGAGVTVVSTLVDSSFTQITVTLNVSANPTLAPLGSRDVTVTNVSAAQSVTKTGAFQITATPTVTGASSPLVQGQDNQLVAINGTNFQSPTNTLPSNLVVTFSGSGITVKSVGYSTDTAIAAVVNVSPTAPQTAYDVFVTNPDGGSATGLGLVSVGASGGAAPPLTGPPSAPPALPSITNFTPSGSGPLGSTVTINGSNFSGTTSTGTAFTTLSVTFTGANGTMVAATTFTLVSSSSITATVPPQATTGTVRVTTTNGLFADSPTLFTVTNPVLAAVLPSSVTTDPSAVKQVPLTISGSRFLSGATVRFSGLAADITIPASGTPGSPTVSGDGTTITLTVGISPTAATGARDVTVTNGSGGPSATLTGGFQIQTPPTAGFNITLPLFADTSRYLPSVTQVSLTRLASGACNPTTKVVTPTPVQLQAQFVSSSGLTPPASVTFTITPSAIPGTATNEDCEVDPANPTKDFSIGTADLASQQVIVLLSGVDKYVTTLYSYDWGGKVTITVSGTTGGVAATGSLALPVDTDCTPTLCDDLPDAYERDASLNPANVLNFQNANQNGAAGVSDRNVRFARDGLSNFEKYRGVYTVGPAVGVPNGVFGSFQRLGAGSRHLFVRGRGFGDDPAVPAGFCGINPATGAPVADANPCPKLQADDGRQIGIGTAFLNTGVAVHVVSKSFTASTELPRTSLVNPTQAILDLATAIYDGVNCKGSVGGVGGEACDKTIKLGVRQWTTPTLGYTTPNGTATTYGPPTVYKRAVEAYFNNRPYQHRTNDPSRVVTAPDGTAMLAPITRVGDFVSCPTPPPTGCGSGNDNGLVDSAEVTVSGQLAGDTYISGKFDQQLSAFDVNNDGCVELPTLADPTTIARCTPNLDTAAFPSATKQQVVRSVVTHELGHATGVVNHTSDTKDIMYLSTVNFIRDSQFSSTAAGYIQIHNKGGVQ